MNCRFCALDRENRHFRVAFHFLSISESKSFVFVVEVTMEKFCLFQFVLTLFDAKLINKLLPSRSKVLIRCNLRLNEVYCLFDEEMTQKVKTFFSRRQNFLKRELLNVNCAVTRESEMKLT